jgi:hypothetical protein
MSDSRLRNEDLEHDHIPRDMVVDLVGVVNSLFDFLSLQ